MDTLEPATWSCVVWTTKRRDRLEESRLRRILNGDSALVPKVLRFCYVPEMLVFHPARRSLHELCVKWDRHTQHAFNMICGNPAWKLRWIVRALAVMASPAVDSIRVLASNRIQGLSTRIKAIGVLFAIRLYRTGKMLTLLNASNKVVWNRDAVEATHLGPEPVQESGTP